MRLHARPEEALGLPPLFLESGILVFEEKSEEGTLQWRGVVKTTSWKAIKTAA